MKVLVLTPSLAESGGIQRYSGTLIRAFKSLLGDEQICCLALPGTSGKASCRVSTQSKLGFLWRVLCESARHRPDLIVCTHLALGPLGWLLATLSGRSYWIVVYGIEAWVQLPRVKYAALSRADRIIGISDFSREQLRKRQGIPAERLSRLPCALDEALLKVEPKQERGQDEVLGLDCRKQRVVLTVARISASERYKGHDVVLRALPPVVSRFSDLVYVIVGEGDDRGRLQRLVDKLKLGEHVVFTGAISDSTLTAFYRRSDVFILPAQTVVDNRDSKGEGFGIVFLEAMAFGKPVIGPDYGAPTELIRHGINGLLVDPQNPVSVTQALIELLENPDAARRMGEAGRVLVQEQYSYDSFRRTLWEILGSSPTLAVDPVTGLCES